MATKRPHLSQKKKLADLEAELSAAHISRPEGQGFVVEFFLDEKKNPRLTQVLHVKSGEGEQWQGWDENRLLDFIAKRVDVKGSKPRKHTPSSHPIREGDELMFDLKNMEIKTDFPGFATRLLRKGDPFSIKLSFVLQEASKNKPKDFDYQFYLSAMNTDDQTKDLLALEQGSIHGQQDSITVKVDHPNLRPGTYRFHASMYVTDSSLKPMARYKHASVSQVYQVY